MNARTWILLAAVLAGSVAATWGGVQAYNTAFELLTNETIEVPASFERDLIEGEHEIHMFAEAAFGDSSTVFVTPEDITITSPTGQILSIASAPLEDVTRGLAFYEGVGTFSVSDPGRHRFDVLGVGETRLIVAPSIENSIPEAAGWAIVMVVGAMVALVAGVILIVLWLRDRRRTRETETFPGAAGFPIPPSTTPGPPPPPPGPSSPPPTPGEGR